MHWTETKRRLSQLAAGSALLLATGCGGGDHSPTGPGGGIAGGYDMVAVGQAGLPADADVEDCTMTRFYSGRLQLNGNGTWQIRLNVNDDNYGDWTSVDEGQFQQDGATVWLNSKYSGATNQATLDDGDVTIMYDWCYNGVPDVQLVFER
jgi:hypothetical protein